VDYSVAGTIGSRTLFTAFANCLTSKGKVDMSLTAGVAPVLQLSLRTSLAPTRLSLLRV